jgi:hypothetical protein
MHGIVHPEIHVYIGTLGTGTPVHQTAVTANAEQKTGLKSTLIGDGRISISYNLERGAAIKLAIYSCLGQKACNLESGFQVAGPHRAVWNGKNKNSAGLQAVYFVRLDTGDKIVNTKVFRLPE